MDSDDQNLEQLDYLIIGGGVSGLAAANRLVDLGIKPTIVDAGSYPSHKICGEFFSFECHQILENWDVLPSTVIRAIKFHIDDESYHFPLPIVARGMSRFSFDNFLYQRAVEKGAKALINMRVTKIDYHSDAKFKYSISLHNGKILQAKTLFIGTGRILSLLIGGNSPTMRYLGMKSHFKGIDLKETLQMFVLPHGYLGMSPIENNQINVACIAEKVAVSHAGSPEKYLKQVMETQEGNSFSKLLSLGTQVFPRWMVTEVPEFCITNDAFHSYRNLFLIGDAAASIAPASGDGLAMGVTSAVMAVEFALKGKDFDYQKYWSNNYRKRLRWAKGIHQLMFHPFMSKVALRFCSQYPQLFHYLYRKTRGVKGIYIYK